MVRELGVGGLDGVEVIVFGVSEAGVGECGIDHGVHLSTAG